MMHMYVIGWLITIRMHVNNILAYEQIANGFNQEFINELLL